MNEKQKGANNIKNKILSFIKKTTVLLLACLMVIFVVPVWIFPSYDTPSAEGDFVRLSPIDSTYSQYSYKDSPSVPIGKGSAVYLKFRLAGYSKINPDEITSVKLRLTFLAGSGSKHNSIRIGYTDTDSRLTSEKSAGSPCAIGPVSSIVAPYTVGSCNSISEIDITDYAKALLASDKTDITFLISSDASIPALMANNGYDDSTCRPYLKITTGMANDTDSYTHQKTLLSDCTFVSEASPDTLGYALSSKGTVTAGNQNEIYLKFKLNREAIRDTLYSAKLRLTKTSGKGKISICTVSNNEWSSELITYHSRPRGKESVSVDYNILSNDEPTIDISQLICDAAAKSDIVTLKITGPSRDSISFSGANTADAPALYLKTSSRPEIECVQHAALSATGTNLPDHITKALTETYTDQNGKTATFQWRECPPLSKSSGGISPRGEITRPKWFEGKLSITAAATIKCGDYSIERLYPLTIPAESPPNYSKLSFDNYIDIGNNQSEESHKFESLNIDSGSKHFVNGRQFSYRTPRGNGTMILNLMCSPNTQNFLTLKFRCDSDSAAGKIQISPTDNSEVSSELIAPNFASTESRHFVYATYPLPETFTRDKKQISLKLHFPESSSRIDKYADIYAAYITQDAFFEPKQFAKQGEIVISEPYLGANAINEFIEMLKAFSISDSNDSTVEDDTPDSITAESSPAFSETESTVRFDNSETNMAFSFSDDNSCADIYQRTPYYDRYCSQCPSIIDGQLVMINFGDYKLVRNLSDTDTLRVPTDKLEFAGTYKNLADNTYYSFTEDTLSSEDSGIPSDAEVLKGDEMTALPGQTLLLNEISEPVYGSDWRVIRINNDSVAELSYASPSKIDNVSIKAVGSIPSDIDSAEVIFCVLKDGKLINMYRSEFDVTESISQYDIDTSGYELYLDKSTVLRVFVKDKRTPANKLEPKLELPKK